MLGESFRTDDSEDSSIERIENLSLSGVRYSLEIDSVSSGNIVLISGIDRIIQKTATIVCPHLKDIEIAIFKPIKYPPAIVKLALEPLLPTNLNSMLNSLKRVSKFYPSLRTKMEESGECLVYGTGELYLDCALFDLRNTFPDGTPLEVRITEPLVSFCETVADVSYLKCYGSSPNGKNKVTMLAEPLENELAISLENGLFMFTPLGSELGRIEISSSLASQVQSDPIRSGRIVSTLKSTFGWDPLEARGLLGIGPDHLIGSNVLIDDTLPSEVQDKSTIQVIKENLLQGFRWAMKSGPLCEEPIRGVKLKIIDISIAKEPKDRTSGQIVPLTRKVCLSSMLTASPRLLEPVNHLEIIAPFNCTEVIYGLLSKRRGHIVQEFPKAGSPLYVVKALLPVIESFGFETDLRVYSHGMAFSQQFFSHWQIVPGDPLDGSIRLSLLEPSPAPFLSRDFVLKTRRRKGLVDDIAISRYFDDPNLLRLAKDALTNKK